MVVTMVSGFRPVSGYGADGLPAAASGRCPSEFGQFALGGKEQRGPWGGGASLCADDVWG